MRVQLLACLETLVQSIERDMDVCARFHDTCQGVAVKRSRADHICPGYDARAHKDEREIASLLLQTAAQFVFFRESVLHHLKLCKAPSAAQLHEVVDLLHRYQECGGQIGSPESDPVSLCGPRSLWGGVV